MADHGNEQQPSRHNASPEPAVAVDANAWPEQEEAPATEKAPADDAHPLLRPEVERLHGSEHVDIHSRGRAVAEDCPITENHELHDAVTKSAWYRVKTVPSYVWLFCV